MKHLRKQILGSLFFLLLVKFSLSQTELANVQGRLTEYTKNNFPEKLFVHTDKSSYVTGEIIWFKLYAVDGVLHKPLIPSKVAYLELLDKNNTAVSRAKIALENGDGSLQLPLHLQSGYYTIRAYTNLMKNLGAEYFFEKQISIVNPLKSPEVPDEKQSPAYSLQLFPEGGNMVKGLSSKIAFQLTDKFGKGLEGKGFLLNAKGDTLSSFTPFKFGIGHFDFTPGDGNAYQVVFSLSNGNIVSKTLPKSFETGYVMRVEELANDKVRITVRTNIKSGYPEIYLMAQTRQVVKVLQKNIIADGVASFIVDKKILDPGVSQFTIFNNEKKPVCERLFFVQPTSKAPVSITPSKASYTSRNEVMLSIDLPALDQQNISLSVYQIDSLQTKESVNINHYLWLTSELAGSVEQPAYYFSASSEEVKEASDDLMLTHGWRRFNWETVFNSPAYLKFPLENSGHIITGKVTDMRTNSVAKGVQVYLSIPATKYKLYTALSDSKGMIQFHVKDYYGQGEMILQTNTQRDSLYKLEILSPFAETFIANPPLPFALLSSVQSSLINNSIGMQAQQIYIADSIRHHFMPAIADSFPFYGQPLYSYKLDEYVRFNTIEEILREYVREINVGMKGGGTSLRFKLFNETDRELYTDDILVMADGIPFFNPNKIFSIDPLKIKKLDIITKNYILGYSSFHGLANFSSYSGNYEGLSLDPKAVIIDYEGLQLQRQFYSPDYSTTRQKDSRIPDLRSTLFWLPNVKTKQIKFYTSDNKGRYVVVLQGIDATGQILTGSSQFEVK